MRSFLLRWFDQALAAVADLMDRPWSLFFALLAVNAVALPYRGILHDSQLYAVQVMNRVENGAYADDLFFRYGSQDKFSVFSLAAAPLARVLGLQNTFFVLYLVFNSLLLLAAAPVDDAVQGPRRRRPVAAAARHDAPVLRRLRDARRQ